MSAAGSLPPPAPRIGLTGGIACGKSLFLRRLEALGFETLDADDIVRGLVPERERRRLAKTVFKDAAARKALEAKLHPVVRERIGRFFAGSERGCVRGSGPNRIAAVPLLYEAGWEGDFDVVACIASSREKQVSRMVQTRGMTPEEAADRIAAQMDVREKAARADWVAENDGSPAELAAKAEEFARWIESGAWRRRTT